MANNIDIYVFTVLNKDFLMVSGHLLQEDSLLITFGLEALGH